MRSRDALGNVAKLVPPTVANGKVYVATFSNRIDVYGLLPTPNAASPTFSPVPGAYTGAQQVTLADTTPGAVIHYTTDGSTPTGTSPTYGGTPLTVSHHRDRAGHRQRQRLRSPAPVAGGDLHDLGAGHRRCPSAWRARANGGRHRQGRHRPCPTAASTPAVTPTPRTCWAAA